MNSSNYFSLIYRFIISIRIKSSYFKTDAYRRVEFVSMESINIGMNLTEIKWLKRHDYRFLF